MNIKIKIEARASHRPPEKPFQSRYGYTIKFIKRKESFYFLFESWMVFKL